MPHNNCGCGKVIVDARLRCVIVNASYTLRCELENYRSVKIALKNETPTIFRHNYTPKSKKIDGTKLSLAAKKVYNDPNAGGSSFNSEAMSADVLVQLFNAHSLVTEMEIDYCISNWKKCDYLITIFGHQVGVSVTRAMGYPDPSHFTLDDAEHLLHRKLFGLITARQGIKKRHRFTKSILHIWCEIDDVADLVTEAYNKLIDHELKDNVTIILTVSHYELSASIYYDYLDRPTIN